MEEVTQNIVVHPSARRPIEAQLAQERDRLVGCIDTLTSCFESVFSDEFRPNGEVARANLLELRECVAKLNFSNQRAEEVLVIATDLIKEIATLFRVVIDGRTLIRGHAVQQR